MARSKFGNLFKRAWMGLTGKGGRALVIDPSPDAAALLASHLQNTRIRLDAAASPGDAFEYIHRHADEPPHVFVIGFRQPDGTTGVETARLLGNIRTVSRAPVIIVHDRMAEDKLLSLKRMLPRAEFVERPYPGKRMHDLVVACVKRGQHRPAARSSLGNTHSMPPPPRIRWRG